MTEKTWSGRFSEKTNHRVEAFTASVDFDRRLYPYDIEGSIAHCRMLAKTGIITEDEAATLVQGLGQIKRDLDRGLFQFHQSMEDIHMHIETRLVEDVGKVALKLHTARSRNDQVALDVRMFLREATVTIIGQLHDMREALVDQAEANIDVVLPGYTHMQRAQPVLFAHHLMAYYEMFSRDEDRFKDSLKRLDVMPLGTAALAGTTFPIDRNYTAELLNFPTISSNSIHAVSDRDFMIVTSLFGNMKLQDEDIRNVGIKMAPFVVLSQIVVPSVLVEISCISKVEEEAKLAVNSYREKVASYIEEGIVSYMETQQLKNLKGES